MHFADRVAQDIHVTEEALDEALGRACDLVSRLVDARREAGLSTIVGHDIFESVNNASALITRARGEMVQAHRRITVVARALRLEPTASSPVAKPDEIGLEQPNVRLVRDRGAA